MIQTSEQIKTIAAALSAFQAEMPPVSFDSVNPFLGNKYASLGQIVRTAQPHLTANGLVAMQFPVDGGLCTRLVHTSGEWMQAFMPYPASDGEKGKSSSQLLGSMITYMRRYALVSILGIVADEDNDGNTPDGVKPQTVAAPKQKDKPWLNAGTEAFDKVRKAIERDGYTIADVEKKYKLNKDIRAQLEVIETNAWQIAEGIKK